MLLLPAILFFLAAAPAAPLSRADLLLLLEIGVSEQEITALATRRGGFEPVDAETRSTAESLGATPAFLDRLPRSAPDYGAISALARSSDVFEDKALGIGFVYPAGWSVSRHGTDGKHGTLILRVSPRTIDSPKAFVTPCIFIFMQDESGLVPEATPSALGEVKQMILRRLRAAGLRPTATTSEATMFLGQECDTMMLEAPVDGGNLGVLGLALLVDSKGRATGVGFTAAAGDRAATSEAFLQLARSFVQR